MKVLIIGRAADCDITITDQHVSRQHVQLIIHDDEKCSIVDLNSTTGTYVNGNKIKGEHFLQEHDIVKIGNSLIPWKEYIKDINSQWEMPTEPESIFEIEKEKRKETSKLKEKKKNPVTTNDNGGSWALRIFALLLIIIFGYQLLSAIYFNINAIETDNVRTDLEYKKSISILGTSYSGNYYFEYDGIEYSGYGTYENEDYGDTFKEPKVVYFLEDDPETSSLHKIIVWEFATFLFLTLFGLFMFTVSFKKTKK